jgi:hypothetical protein
MTRHAMRQEYEPALERVDKTVDHVRGPAAAVGHRPWARRRTVQPRTGRVDVSAGTWKSGMASGEVRGTPTLFIDGAVHRGAYDAATLLEALAR